MCHKLYKDKIKCYINILSIKFRVVLEEIAVIHKMIFSSPNYKSKNKPMK